MIGVAMRPRCPRWPSPGGPPLPRSAACSFPDVDFFDGSNGQQDGPLWPTLRFLPPPFSRIPPAEIPHHVGMVGPEIGIKILSKRWIG